MEAGVEIVHFDMEPLYIVQILVLAIKLRYGRLIILGFVVTENVKLRYRGLSSIVVVNILLGYRGLQCIILFSIIFKYKKTVFPLG